MPDRLESQVLEIANGKISGSRIARIYQAKFQEKVDVKLVYQICQEHNIETPKADPNRSSPAKEYPDIWSFHFEATSFWIRVRRYWGDIAAATLKDRILATQHFRSLYRQFTAYADSAIYERKKINFAQLNETPLPFESLYEIEEVREKYLEVYFQEFRLHPEPQAGVKYPLPCPEYEKFRRQKYREEAIAISQEKFPDANSMLNFFADFWREVRSKRGQFYFDNLKRLVIDCSNGYYPKTPYYSLTENNLRTFLLHLNSFKTSGRPYQKPVNCLLPMPLEGLMARYGADKVASAIALGLALSACQSSIAS